MKFSSFIRIFKKVLFFSFLILVGIIIENRFHLMMEIVEWENRYFHKEEYDFVMKLQRIDSSKNIMAIKGEVLYSSGAPYEAEILIPKGYSVKNKKNQNGIINKEGYSLYLLRKFRKKYRDLCSYDGLLISPKSPDISKKPIIVAIVSGKEIKYQSEIYSIETINNEMLLSKLDTNKEKKPEKSRCTNFG